MEVVKTPETRFHDLEDYPFEPNYLSCDGLQIHTVDEGDNENEVVVMLHGEPTWSFLYRKMIPIVRDAGFRVVAPDFIGFGKSDKPVDKNVYTYQQHVDWMAAFLRKLDLKNITLFCQDWGGLIGLRLAAEHEHRFKRIVAANTTLLTGDLKMPKAFLIWQNFSQKVKLFSASRIVNRGTVNKIDESAKKGYDAPFPSEKYKAGARIFPTLVPTTSTDPATVPNRAAWEILKRWEKPFLTAFSDSDSITKGGERYLKKVIPGARDQDHVIIKGAGHFLQEDKGEELGKLVVDFISRN